MRWRKKRRPRIFRRVLFAGPCALCLSRRGAHLLEMTQPLSYTTGALRGALRAVRCAHKCMASGEGFLLFEISSDYDVSVTALDQAQRGYDILLRCKNHSNPDGKRCRGWNGVRFHRKQLAA